VLFRSKGFISPAVFIPLAEATNQIGTIGEWVLESACRQASNWLRAGLNLERIGVNVSGRQFQNKNLFELVQKILAETGLPPDRLELEITETAVTASPVEASRLLQALRESGVMVALDDFGQGFSSLGQLKDLPVDRLKIDAAFVRDITGEPGHKSGAIASAAIGLGHALGFKVIAEGVETETQLAFLMDQACDEVQGYYFARPMPAAEFEAFLRERMS
jgi:EAL domain-containing protein (putative c-di-GMP-specific phosphodiesterase class I)